MNKLTLPIEPGKKYLRRDGKIATTATACGNTVFINNSVSVYTETGRYSHKEFQLYGQDLVADYVDSEDKGDVNAHVHAASMLLYAYDAAKMTEPWLNWEWKDGHEGSWFPCVAMMVWSPKVSYRQKPKCININGFQVPEPIRIMPEKGICYYVANIIKSVQIHSSTWRGDFSDTQFFKYGLCHLTQEAAEAHVRALRSFTEIKFTEGQS